MFLGSDKITMDSKGRLSVPARVREEFAVLGSHKVVVTAHPDERCLLMYPEAQWSEILPGILQLPDMNKQARRIRRLMMGYATSLEIDGNGRILLAPTLREYAGLDKKLMLIGGGKRLELWSEESWAGWLDQDGDESLSEDLASSLNI